MVVFVCSFEYCGKEEHRWEHMEAHIAAVHLQHFPFVCEHQQCAGVRKPTAFTIIHHHNTTHGQQQPFNVRYFLVDDVILFFDDMMTIFLNHFLFVCLLSYLIISGS